MQMPREQLTSLQLQLSQLEVNGAGQYDPFRLHYCQALLISIRHLSDSNNTPSAALLKKLSSNIHQLETEHSEYSLQAEQQLNHLLSVNQVAYEYLQEEFQANNFNAIFRAAAKLKQGQQFIESTLIPIQALTQQLNQLSSDRGLQSQSNNLDSFLRQADSDLIDALDSSSQLNLPQGSDQLEPPRLHSLQLFRQSQQQYNTAHLVQQAIADSPEKPGPLNPHMLTIRSLTLMQDLSPKYLERFVNYIDSVHWLEQHGEKIANKMRKKT